MAVLYDEDEYKRDLEMFNKLSSSSSNTSENDIYSIELRNSLLLSLKSKHIINAKNQSLHHKIRQYGLLGHHVGNHENIEQNQPILLNIQSPQSIFLCGSQGSGKSYSLSCILESSLLSDPAIGKLTNPLSGVVFHWDSGSLGVPAEIASLCSKGVKIRVLRSPCCKEELIKAYSDLPGADSNLTTAQLMFQNADLSVESLQKLMAFTESKGGVPLYMEVLQGILRRMARDGEDIDYNVVKQRLLGQNLSVGQRDMLKQRLEILENFLEPNDRYNGTPQQDLFTLEPSTLTIIDLTDQFLDKATACTLFAVCLDIINQRHIARISNAQTKTHKPGVIFTCDEAHKYLDNSDAATDFTERLLKLVREQRHYGARVVIATQEPTISESLLGLCDTTIIHRFNSPAWFATIKGHLAGASSMTLSEKEQNELFQRITTLHAGEAIVFAPSSYVCVDGDGRLNRLGCAAFKMKTRLRVSHDAGQSQIASG